MKILRANNLGILFGDEDYLYSYTRKGKNYTEFHLEVIENIDPDGRIIYETNLK